MNSSGYTLDSTAFKKRTATQDIYFKLKNPLQYVLNPSVDINLEKTKIYMSYSITLENGNVINSTNPFFYDQIDSLIVSEDENTNLWLMHDISRIPNNGLKGTRRQLQLASGWYEVENVTNLLFGSKLETSLYYREDYSTFTPVCGTNGGTDVSVPTLTGTGLHFTPTKIEVKVMADMYFDQLSFTGEEINTTQVFTYLLLDTEQNIDLIADSVSYIPWASLPSFIQMFPGELTIESQVISETSPEAYPASNFLNVFVRADNVIIDKPLSGLIVNLPAADPLINVMAYDQIHIKPGAHIEKNVRLSINKDIYGVAASLPAPGTFVDSFCSSNSYLSSQLKSNSTDVNPGISDASQDIDYKLELESIKLNLYPNPTTGQLTISATQSITFAELYDLAGRRLIQEYYGDGGGQQVQLDLSALSNGVYVVKATCRGKIFTERVVVSR